MMKLRTAIFSIFILLISTGASEEFTENRNNRLNSTQALINCYSALKRTFTNTINLQTNGMKPDGTAGFIIPNRDTLQIISLNSSEVPQLLTYHISRSILNCPNRPSNLPNAVSTFRCFELVLPTNPPSYQYVNYWMENDVPTIQVSEESRFTAPANRQRNYARLDSSTTGNEIEAGRVQMINWIKKITTSLTSQGTTRELIEEASTALAGCQQDLQNSDNDTLLTEVVSAINSIRGPSTPPTPLSPPSTNFPGVTPVPPTPLSPPPPVNNPTPQPQPSVNPPNPSTHGDGQVIEQDNSGRRPGRIFQRRRIFRRRR